MVEQVVAYQLEVAKYIGPMADPDADVAVSAFVNHDRHDPRSEEIGPRVRCQVVSGWGDDEFSIRRG